MKGLLVDWSIRGSNAHKLTEEQFETMVEVDCIGDITGVFIKRFQNEQCMNRAYRPVLHSVTNNQLAADSLLVLNLEDVYRQPAKHLLRVSKERSNFTALGSEIWDRAEQDAKIRHKHSGAGMNRRDLLCAHCWRSGPRMPATCHKQSMMRPG
jgi:hypothetical protein